MNAPPVPSLTVWHMQLRQLAAARELQWLVCSDPEAHRAAYESGLSPEEEMSALAELGTWRGYGCSGG